jgi:hypothetical protein
VTDSRVVFRGPVPRPFRSTPADRDGGCAGWTVERAEKSTLDEWDDFERGWVEGAWRVGSPEARAFAAEREDEYQRHYRGVLGFAWLFLHGSVPAASESSVR